jgi:hypothetical protein
MFTSVPDIAIAAADRRRALLAEAAAFRLARQVARTRSARRGQPAAEVQPPERLPRSASKRQNYRGSVPP